MKTSKKIEFAIFDLKINKSCQRRERRKDRERKELTHGIDQLNKLFKTENLYTVQENFLRNQKWEKGEGNSSGKQRLHKLMLKVPKANI